MILSSLNRLFLIPSISLLLENFQSYLVGFFGGTSGGVFRPHDGVTTFRQHLQ